jgi:hypothetical protein
MKPCYWASFTGLWGWETIVAFRFRRLFCRSNLLKTIIEAASRTAGLFVTFLLGEQKKSNNEFDLGSDR